MGKYKDKKHLYNSDMARISNRQSAILKLYDQPELAKLEALEKLKSLGLENVLDDYFLPDNYNLDKLKNLEINTPRLQIVKLPFKNQDIKIMLDMPKIQISTPKIEHSMGKTYHSVYLIGKYKDKKMVYLLSVEYARDQKRPPCDFHIKLDALVGGKTWFSLMRIDSMGNPHPNYFENGVPVKTYNEVKKIRTPHLHTASYEAQMFTNTTHYSNAEELDFLDYENINFEDGTLFTSLMQTFLKRCNAEVNIKDVAGSWFDFDNTNIFDTKIIDNDEVINWIL